MKGMNDMNDNGRNSNNPMLRKSLIEKAARDGGVVMTHRGAMLKTLFLFLILSLGVAVSWTANFSLLYSYAGLVGLLVAGTALSLVTAFVPRVSPFTSPIYAMVEGLLLGAITAVFDASTKGIALQALLITTGIFLVTYVFYSARIITVTNRLRMGIFTATLGIGFVYLADFALSFFGLHVPFLTSTGLVGIAVSLLIVIIASLNFLLDFDYVDRCCAMGAPKYMEWYMGYSIMVTFVWLYLEVLRLLAKIQGSSK